MGILFMAQNLAEWNTLFTSLLKQQCTIPKSSLVLNFMQVLSLLFSFAGWDSYQVCK